MIVVYIWTAIAAAGVVVQSLLIFDSFRTLTVLRQRGFSDGGRRRVITGHLRSGTAYWLVHSIFLYVGLQVLLELRFGAVPWLFVSAAVVLVIAGLTDYYDRILLRRSNPGKE